MNTEKKEWIKPTLSKIEINYITEASYAGVVSDGIYYS